MEYVRYEKMIVEKHGILIAGWTYDAFVNPSEFRKVADVEELYNAIVEGTCKAKKMSDCEWKARKASNRARFTAGELIYGPPPQKRKRKAALDDGDTSDVDKRQAGDPPSMNKENAGTVSVPSSLLPLQLLTLLLRQPPLLAPRPPLPIRTPLAFTALPRRLLMGTLSLGRAPAPATLSVVPAPWFPAPPTPLPASRAPVSAPRLPVQFHSPLALPTPT